MAQTADAIFYQLYFQQPGVAEAELDDSVMLPGCGHWTQQERRAEVNAAMVRFLKTLH